jgi:hypothetical protein
VITQVATLMTTTYDGFNDVHLTEKLQERHALPISRATVRRLRVALGRPPLWGTLQDRLPVAAGGGGRNQRGEWRRIWAVYHARRRLCAA